MSNRIIQLSALVNLRMLIYVVGYPQQGESILVLLSDAADNSIIYSMVIDSFSYQAVNKTTEILNYYHIDRQKLNMLCWSHPDHDHTYGMNKLLTNYCNSETKILYPYGIVGHTAHILKHNKGDETIFSLMKRLNDCKQMSKKPVSVDDGQRKTFGIKVGNYSDNYNIEINALSPFDSCVNYYLDQGGSKKIKKNALSIVLHIKMPGNYGFLFCSDAEDDTLQHIDNAVFVDPLFVKIPHHGSNTSCEMFRLLSSPSHNTIGCVTGYKKHGLPLSDVLDNYLNHSTSNLTRLDYTGYKKNRFKFGVIEYKFDLYQKKELEIKHYGQAGRYGS